jgi:uncharacterized membrane protein
MNDWVALLTLCSALGSGLMAGVFFAFSTFVMRALARRPFTEGIEAMQEINRTVLNPWFLGVFFGTAGGCLVLVGMALWEWPQSGGVYVILGGLLYLIGTFLVTAVFNVPMNDALEAVDPAGPDAASTWTTYVETWTAWNHVRSVAALMGAALLILALHTSILP